MTKRKAPADGAIVAKLAYPIPAGALDRIVRGIEACYGTGLVVRTDLPDAREFLSICNPQPPEASHEQSDRGLVRHPWQPRSTSNGEDDHLQAGDYYEGPGR